MTKLNVVAVTGSLHAPSKTIALVEAILAELGAQLPIDAHLIKLNELGPSFAGVLTRPELPENVERELQRIETADLLVVASPVYRASFTGLFKHLFDFVDQYALVDTPILLAATGGSERHALIIEHQFRPLFSFFQALTLPLGIYAHDSDFSDYTVSSTFLKDRIRKVVERSLPLISSNFAEKQDIAKVLDGRVVREPEATAANVPIRLLS
ncbi:FMN reductase [Lacisediminihabitans profunda]|uniref:FMN reductase n=1 Tax=Lacisediminihabitans profunda TaxID=2594790 RepID=A0A5C8UR79_9MICO|nr:FMN reductase [Lacisediminihabitans profunda]TXN31025.1 FMN reductase [Lacisediminihabitans profunda]